MRDTAGLKACSEKEFIGWIEAWMTKSHREQSLAKPSTIHILILIPVIRQYVLSDDSSTHLPKNISFPWQENLLRL